MKPTPYSFDETSLDPYAAEPNFDGQSQQSAAAAIAVEEVPQSVEVATGPRCEKCSAPLPQDVVTICRSCGWYSSLGTFVEIEPNWETDDKQDVAAPAQKSHVRVWFELIPISGWVIIASVLAIVVESVIARLFTDYGSELRTTWSLTQLGIGAAAMIGGHMLNFLLQVTDDPDVGIFDVVLKPLKLWLTTFRRLPAKLWLVDSAVSGMVAVIMSIVVIGGLPYERLWDWGISPPAKQELMGAIMDQVKKVEGQEADSLEDAVGDFAGKAGLDDEKTPPKPRKSADCVILGYTTDPAGRLNTLVLGTAHLGKLVYAGNLTPKFDSRDEAAGLLKKLAANKSSRRLIAVETEATWVQPKVSCRVFYGERKPDGRLMDIGWNELIGTLRTQTKSSR